MVKIDFLRWQRFFLNWLWLALPVVVALCYGLVWLVVHADPTLPASEVRRETLGAVILPGLAWIVGMWSATQDVSARKSWAERAGREGRPAPTAGQRLFAVATIAFAVLLAVGLLAWTAVDTIRETGSLALGFSSALTYLLSFLSGCVPLVLSRR